MHPALGGNTSIDGFINWKSDSTELPDIEMVSDAVESAGRPITSAIWGRFPGDITAGPGSPWYKKDMDVVRRCSFATAVRWSQRVVEQYRLRLEVHAAIAKAGEIIQRERVVLDTDSAPDSLWESSRTTVGDDGEIESELITRPVSRSGARLMQAASVAMARARTRLL